MKCFYHRRRFHRIPTGNGLGEANNSSLVDDHQSSLRPSPFPPSMWLKKIFKFLSREDARQELFRYCQLHHLKPSERAFDFFLDCIDKNLDEKYEASLKAARTGYMEIPGAKRLAPEDRSAWKVGDIVEVKSLRQKKWFDDGVIVECAPKDENGHFNVKVSLCVILYAYSRNGVTMFSERLCVFKAWKWASNMEKQTFRAMEERKAADIDGKDDVTKDEKDNFEEDDDSQEMQIVKMHLAKLREDQKQAIVEEDFDRAKKLKYEIGATEEKIVRVREALRRAKEEANKKKEAVEHLNLKELEKQKADAVKNEDYGTAARLKNEIESLVKTRDEWLNPS
eukprot:jgi/Bigna1/145572/aug1.100_g20280